MRKQLSRLLKFQRKPVGLLPLTAYHIRPFST